MDKPISSAYSVAFIFFVLAHARFFENDRSQPVTKIIQRIHEFIKLLPFDFINQKMHLPDDFFHQSEKVSGLFRLFYPVVRRLLRWFKGNIFFAYL